MIEKFQKYEQMVKDGKSIELDIFNNSKPSLIKQNAEKLRAAYKGTLKELSLTGFDQPKRDFIAYELKTAAAEEMSILIQKERQKVGDQISKLEESYNRNQKLNRDEIDRDVRQYERKLQGMSIKELKEEATNVLIGKDILSEQYDLLSRELKTADPTMHQVLRDEADRLHAYSPHLKTEAGQELLKTAKVLKSAIDGKNFLVETEDGVEIMSLSTYLDAEDQS